MAIVACACYDATLLPGLDFGDTASFQTGVGSFDLTPRQAYPLYYGLGNVFAWLDPGEPAHAMNIASAVYGALAAGVATWVAAELAGSVAGGVAAGLFLAFSYTFWTQAIIAEVYTLHLLIVGLCLASLLAWARKPALGRLAVFYAIFALGFGNHLSMVLLLPAFTIFILLNRTPGPDDPLQPKAIALALLIAALGALQYAWNFRGLWLASPPPSGVADAFGRFWFDVTKADWRETLVMTVSNLGLRNRPSMYWFDLHQQFGTIGIVLAAAGFGFIALRWPRAAILLLLSYLANVVFAWNYNVGDVHVFFLPSHYIVALCAGAGVAAIARVVQPGLRAVAILFCLAYPLWRGYDTFPAVDRSWDERPARVVEQLTDPPDVSRGGVLAPNAIFGVDTNWQVENAVEYYMRRQRPDVPWFTSGDLPWLSAGNLSERLERFVSTNLSQMHREILITPTLAATLRSLGYQGGFMDTGMPDPLSSLADGTPYALAILRPLPEYPIVPGELASEWSRLTGGAMTLPAPASYTIVVGEVGRRPVFVESEDRPFRARTSLGSARFDIRMESWLPTDTIRRAGFGHVIVNRRHVLTLERGISLVTLDAANRPALVAYRSGIFAPIPRLLLALGPHRP